MQFLIFLSFISLQFILGVSNKPHRKEGRTKVQKNHISGVNSNRKRIIMSILAIAAIILFSILLYKLWKMKKRAEQQARLLRLFEEDDELELELGLQG